MTDHYRLAIIGHPVGHSMSPLMHALAAKRNGLALTYDKIDTLPGQVGETVARLRDEGYHGFNVTVPHKIEVMEYLDHISEEAKLIGAVNTVVIGQDGRLTGYNTDAYGFVAPLKKTAGFDPEGKSVFMYGAGGAARAVAVGLLAAQVASLTIANRTVARAQELKERLVTHYRAATITAIGFDDKNLVESVGGADIIVNTSSVGLGGQTGSLPGEDEIKGGLVVDIVYQPLETKLLIKANALGAATLDGLWMLIHQGDRAFNIWTGKNFPIEEVRSALLARLRQETASSPSGE